MSQPVTVNVNGAVVAAPSSSTALIPSLASTMMLSLNRTYGYKVADSGSVNSPSSPVALPLGSITKVRFIALRIIGAPVTVTVTSPQGTAQAFQLGDLWIWHNPNEGGQITAIGLQGVTDFEFMLLGD